MNTSLIIEKVIVFQNKELTQCRSYAIIRHREWSEYEHTFDKVGKQISTNFFCEQSLYFNENQSRLGIQPIICEL